MDFKELNNGVKMPIQGFGVFQIPDATECERVFRVRNCSSRPKHGFQKWVMNGHCEH